MNPFNAKGMRPKMCFRQQKPGLTAKGDQRLFVKHNYTDHANEEDAVTKKDGTSFIEKYELIRYNMDGEPESYSKRKKLSPLFPLKLFMILDEVESKGNSSVISWLPHGRAFYIRNNDLFAKKVLPEYFKNCKIASFFRQLNLYDFVRLTVGFDNGAYYHESFLRGKPFLTRSIIRTKVKGTKFRAVSSPEDEPDFYSMPSLPSSSRDITQVPFENTSKHLSGAELEPRLKSQIEAPPAGVFVTELNQSMALLQKKSTGRTQTDFTCMVRDALPLQSNLSTDLSKDPRGYPSKNPSETSSLIQRTVPTSLSQMGDTSCPEVYLSQVTSNPHLPTHTSNWIYDKPTSDRLMVGVRASSETMFNTHGPFSTLCTSPVSVDAIRDRATSIASASYFNGSHYLPRNMQTALGCRNSEFDRHILKTATSSPVIDNTQKMARIFRALEMNHSHILPNAAPHALNIRDNSAHNQLPLNYVYPSRFSNDVISLHMQDRSSLM